MTIQNLPVFFDMVFVKDDKRLSTDGYLYNDQMFQTLNYSVFAINSTISTYVQQGTLNPFGLSPVPQPGALVIIGLNPPSFTTAQINAIVASVAPGPTVPVGTIFYNSTLDKLQFRGASAIQTITSV